jgi:hypothetical protein
MPAVPGVDDDTAAGEETRIEPRHPLVEPAINIVDSRFRGAGAAREKEGGAHPHKP